jgi:vitamin B12 transporter
MSIKRNHIIPGSYPGAGAALSLSASLLALLLAPSGARAQGVAPGAEVQLPPVVIQGTTLAAPPRKATPAVAGDDEAPAAPAKAQRKSAKPGSAAGTPAPGTGTSAAATEGDGTVAGIGEAGGSFNDGTAGGLPSDRIGNAVAVVTGEELKARQIRNGVEALRSLPGVEVSRTGGVAGISQVRIRGAEAHHTLVVIDGVVANSGTDGEFDFSDLTVEDIERIEVIRGAQSALYGSGALGGVVNVVTKSGRGPLSAMGRVESGARGTVDLAARVSGGNDRIWGAVTVHRQKTEGFNIAPDAVMDEADGSKLTSYSASGGIRPFDGVELTFNARRVSKLVQRDDQTGNGAGSNRSGLIVATDSISEQQGVVSLLGMQLRWDMLDGALTHVVKVNRNTTQRDDTTIADYGFGPVVPSLFSNSSEADTVGYQATYRFATPMLAAARHSLTGLVEHEDQDFTPGSDNITRKRQRLSYAGEWKGELMNRLDLVAGIRHDESDKLPTYNTWRSSASLRLPEIAVRPHASVGTAVKLPSQFQQFGAVTNFVANPLLEAERSFGWDAGVELTVVKDRAIVDVTYFSADLKNKIAAQYTSIFDPAAPFACNAGDFFCSRSINQTGVSERRGVEVAGRFVVVPGLSLGAAYTRLVAQDDKGTQETRRSPNTARADLSYAFDGNRGLVTLAAIYNGDMRDTAFQWPTFNPVVTTLDDYWLVNATASYKVLPNVELYGRVENALDAKYEEVYGFNTGGIAAYAGVKLTYEDAAPRSR